mmetsp:Transcript_77227/g.154799  ORF Transcript_77227/g.154799 Transcript_77227/m.154799 type:complete len:427 (+) Transcript_77227:120-1400(+)
MGKKGKRRTAPVAGAKPSHYIDCDQLIAETEECPGTFRWAADKVFPVLPPFPLEPPRYRGWADFLIWRGGGDLYRKISEDPSAIDALSFPVTLLFAMDRLKLTPGAHLSILALGASRRAEERVARSSNLWEEISYYFPNTHIDLWLIGPEISESSVLKETPMMNTRVYKGTYVDFAKSHAEVMEDMTNTIHITFNGGFGNFPESGKFELLWSWLPDLRLLAASGAPLIFTAANDYGDLKGETAVMQFLGVNWCLSPSANPFSFATTLVGEEFENDDKEGWSRGNSHIYACAGLNSSHKIDSGSANEDMLRALVLKCLASTPQTILVDVGSSWGESSQLCTPNSFRHTNDIIDYSIRREESIVFLRVHTAELESMSSAYLEVCDDRLLLRWPENELDVGLPCHVRSSYTSASFSKTKQLLVVRMPVK